MIFSFSFILIVNILTTNILISINDIKHDVNYERIFLNDPVPVTVENISKEIETYDYVNKILKYKGISYHDLFNKSKRDEISNYITTELSKTNKLLDADVKFTGNRILSKLMKVYALEYDYFMFILSLLISIILYFTPNFIASLKIILIEDKKDWEVLNLIYIFSIFGRMPPYKIETVLSNMLMVSDIYKNIIKELLEGVRNGKGESVFNEVLNKIDNSNPDKSDSELYDMLETMKLALTIGLETKITSIDKMASRMLKWLDIKNIKRRKKKIAYAMVPVALVILLSALYFSYGLTFVSNPSIFLNQ